MANRWHSIEKEMLPSDLGELVELRARLLRAGFSRAKVAGCLDFLLGKAQADEAPMGTNSRSDYRKMLAAVRVGPDPGVPPDETGGASIIVLAAVAGVLGTVAAAAGHPNALLALAPIIQDSVNPQDELAERRNCCWEPPTLLAA